MISRNDIIAAVRATLGPVTVVDPDQFARDQRGGRPDALRVHLRDRWWNVYRQSLADGRPEAAAWDAAWRAVREGDYRPVVRISGPGAHEAQRANASPVQTTRTLIWHDPGRGYHETPVGTPGLLVRSVHRWPMDPEERGALFASQRRSSTPLWSVHLAGRVRLLGKDDFTRMDRQSRRCRWRRVAELRQTSPAKGESS